MTIKWLHILGQWRVSTRAWTISKMVTLSQEFACFGTKTEKAEATERAGVPEGSRYSNITPSSLQKQRNGNWWWILTYPTKPRGFLSALPLLSAHQRDSVGPGGALADTAQGGVPALQRPLPWVPPQCPTQKPLHSSTHSLGSLSQTRHLVWEVSKRNKNQVNRRGKKNLKPTQGYFVAFCPNQPI